MMIAMATYLNSLAIVVVLVLGYVLAGRVAARRGVVGPPTARRSLSSVRVASVPAAARQRITSERRKELVRDNY